MNESFNKAGLRIVPFAIEHSEHFYEINAEWIIEMFYLEEIDKQVLRNPQKYIIDKGGYIFFVEHIEHGIIGSCALKNHDNCEFELTKMGVYAKYRYLKAGEYLLVEVLKKCKKLPIDSLFLISNTICEAAIHLYKKNGFVHDQELLDKYQNEYERTNVAMRHLEI